MFLCSCSWHKGDLGVFGAGRPPCWREHHIHLLKLNAEAVAAEAGRKGLDRPQHFNLQSVLPGYFIVQSLA